MKRLASPLMLVVLLLWSAAAQAATITLVTDLSGANENPPVTTDGSGEAVVILDTVAHTLRVIAEFAGLTGTTTAAHIHCCVAPGTNGPVATTTPTFPDFPLGVTSGSYDRTFDTLAAATYNAPFLAANGGTPAGAEAALFNAMAAALTYLNIHSSFAGGGEIRGQLIAVVPEPGSLALFGLALAVAGALRMRRR